VATLDMRRKEMGVLCPFEGAELGVAWDEVYFRAKWLLHLSSGLATIVMSHKLGWRLCLFF